jgi:DNA-binding XRE family transcriptional regulator
MSRTRSGAAITTPKRRRVTPRQYRAAFAARVRQARTKARYPEDEMALLLGVTRDTYAKYEGRGASLMPHNLIVPFCLACRVSVEWLLTGIGATRPRLRA